MASTTQFSSLSPDDTVLKLPHPYQTEFTIHKASSSSSSADTQLYQLIQNFTPDSKANPFALVSPNLLFTEPADLKSSEAPPPSNNSAWGRARRSPCVTAQWSSDEAPSLAQVWLLLYVLFTVRPSAETLRLEFAGAGARNLGQQLCDVLLAVNHPVEAKKQRPASEDGKSAVVALRSTFWQGAGSPFGPRPVWCPEESPAALKSSNLASYPLTPLLNTMSIQLAGDPQDPERQMQAWHPVRPAKPAPGAVIYSRWIPHLKETFSMVSLDYENEEHLRLFHEWQNDPRVSQGWNETGTLEQHREYLRIIHEDPHQVAVLAKWEDTYFAYFETYWAKEDRLGAYFTPGDFDRGRHSLVGDVRFRGPHRVTAWWSSLVHYLFLDDPRTMAIVGEPKDTNSTVVMYDLIHGFGLEKFVDLPHKRSALVRCSRERFFQLCPLGESEKAVGGMGIGLVPKL